MVDGRLLAAYRSLYEVAAPALQQQQQQGGGSSSSSTAPLGSSWAQHLRQAVARRSQEVLAGMPTPLLQDLERLAAWERQSGDAPHSWGAALAHYSAAVAEYEAQRGSLLGAAAAAGSASAAGAANDAEAQSAASGSSGGPLLDAGAATGEDAALAALLLRQARQAEQGQQEQGGAPGGGEQQQAQSGGSGSILPVVYRAYKKLVLADAILLAD